MKAERLYPTIRPHGIAGEYETPILPVAAQYPNAQMAQLDMTVLNYPEPLDVIFTAQNYHDYHIAQYNLGEDQRGEPRRFPCAQARRNLSHHRPFGSAGMTTAQALEIHRIDEAQVRREVEAAGFVFDGSSDILRNPADTRTLNVFDPAIRGRTDQFVLRFRKPA